MNPYYYFYYKVYKSVSKTNKSIPEWSSALVVSLFPYFNVMTIALYLKISGIEFLPSKSIMVSLFVLLMVFNFYFFLRNEFYKSIIKKYDKLNYSLTGSAIVLIYIISSIVAFMFPFL